MKSEKYASRMKEAKPSFIRESLKLAADPSVISFAGGNPDSVYFPVKEMERACADVLQGDWKTALQYNITEGFPKLREILLERMRAMGVEGGLENLAITSGSQQGLDLSGKVFLDSGDVVIVESPSYMGAINAFKYYQPRFVEVEMDEHGMRMDALEEALQANPGVKFIYTIPDFQNPTGRTMSRERREKIVELAEQYDTIIVEDNPYYDLRFEGEKIPPIKYFDRNDRVIYLGSLSKILCPGLRVGWVMGSSEIVGRYVLLKQAADLHTSELSQRAIAGCLGELDMEGHIGELCIGYKKKKDIMLAKLEQLFPKEVEFTRPEGGLFLWLTLPEGYDSYEMFTASMAAEKIAFVPGDTFYPNGGHANTIRLCYSTMTEEVIADGMERLAALFNRVFQI